MNITSQRKIIQRRVQIPKVHQANYDRAMQGKSLKAGIKAFCLECVCWQKEDVRQCTSLACPLYPYRPYKIKGASNNSVFEANEFCY